MKMRPILRLITGAAGTGKTTRCIERFRDRLIESRSCGFRTPAYFVLPSKEHAERVHSLLARDTRLPGIVEHHVLSISDFIRYRTWSADREAVAQAERRRAVSGILADASWEWMAQSALTRGMADAAASFIREIKSARISPDAFRQAAAAAGGGSRLADLEKLLRLYDAHLEKTGRVDAEDAMRIWARQNTAEAGVQSGEGRAADELIILDGFFGLTPAQFEFLSAAACRSRETIVTLTIGGGARGTLFDYPRKLRDKFLESGFVEERLDPVSRRAASPVLTHLERNLFDENFSIFTGGSAEVPDDPDSGLAGDIRFFETATRRQEWDLAARDILAAVNAGELHFSDCMVTVRSASGIRPLAEEVFGALGVPFELHERRRLPEHPLIRGLIDWLSVWDEDGFGPCVRPGLWADWIAESGIGSAGANAVLCAGLRALPARIPAAAWDGSVERLRGELLPDAADLLERERLPLARLAAPLTPGEFKSLAEDRLRLLEESAGSAAAGEKICLELVRGQVERFAVSLASGTDGRAAARDLAAAIDAGLYSTASRHKNRVQIYDTVLALPKEFRAVYVLGLNRGEFPAEHRQNPFLPDDDRRTFGAAGLPLDLAEERYRNEAFFFYMAVTRASERLVLGRHRLDAEGRECAASPWLEQVRELFGGRLRTVSREPEDVLPEEDRLCVISDLLKTVCREDAPELGMFPAACAAVWDGLDPVRRSTAGFDGTAEEAARRADFWKRPARLEDLAVLERWAGPGPARLSATRAAELVNCRFQYFAKYGLGLKSPDRLPAAEIEEGNVWHRVLQAVYGRYLGAVPPAEEVFIREVREEMERELSASPFRMVKFYERQAREARLRQDAGAFARWEYRDWRSRALRPWGVEVGFGATHPDKPPARFEPLQIVQDGQAFVFSGQIDRLDVDPATRRAAVIDYKTGALPTSADIKQGLAPQAVLYTLAAERFGEWECAGVEFVSIRNRKRYAFGGEAGLELVRPGQKIRSAWTPEEYAKAIADEKQRWAERWANLRAGRIGADPIRCGYCEFGPVCRSRRTGEKRR